jgi:hypothetical protein
MPRAVQTSLDELADRYLELHQHKEQLFWRVMMGLSQEHAQLQEAEVALRSFVSDPARLADLRRQRSELGLSPADASVVDGWIQLFARNVVEQPRARAMQRELIALESELERQRGQMDLGYVDPATGEPVAATSIVLGNMVRTERDEPRRKSAWEGLRTIEEFVVRHGFPEVVVARNRFARALGYEDYYDYKVQWAEGFDKRTLFVLLDDLEARTASRAREDLRTLRGPSGVDPAVPWNHAYITSGSLAQEKDPYFRFEDALERWGRSFAALGIRYRKASVTVDLIDRKGKYENGFMHGPTPAFLRRGEWLPAAINFTANAVPDQPGSGLQAMVTLFHEGGHAAHFANIVTAAPCFSQEFAPTSVAFSETQSMFCDNLLGDADWQTRYARDAQGKPIPFELIARAHTLRQPAATFDIRRLLTVCYFERMLYELPEAEVTPDRILALCRAVEQRLLFFDQGSPRPTLSIPHPLSGDASCYYHGYVLADMAVAQTRAHFQRRYGHILDNPRVGADLTETYWKPGNAVTFLEYVRRLTGRPVSADDLVARANRSVEEVVQEAAEAVARLPRIPEHRGPVDLDLELAVAHGAELVVRPGVPFAQAAETFRQWVRARWPQGG